MKRPDDRSRFRHYLYLPAVRWLYRNDLVRGPVRRNKHGYVMTGRVVRPSQPSFAAWKRGVARSIYLARRKRAMHTATAMVRGGMRARRPAEHLMHQQA